MANKSTKMSKAERQMARRRRNVLLLMFEVIIMLLLCITCYGVSILNSSQYEELETDIFVAPPQVSVVEKTDASGEVVATETVEVTQPAGAATYTNILVLGLDEDGLINLNGGANSDVMIILSINDLTGEVKMASILRDTIMRLEDGTRVNGVNKIYDKANSQFCYTNVSDTVSMINRNLDLDIQEYITFNWNGVAQVIDALGGIEVEISENILDLFNGYLDAVNIKTNHWYPPLEAPGTYNITGNQVVAFCRIRYAGLGDEGRASNHRLVMEKTMEKAKSLLAQGEITQLINVIQTGLSGVRTSIDNGEKLDLLSRALGFTFSDNYQFPQDYVTAEFLGDYFSKYGVRDAMAATDMAAEVVNLHTFLFGDTGYEPSDFIKAVSAQIQEDMYADN